MDIKKILEMFKVNEETGLLSEEAQSDLENYLSEVVELKALDKAKEIAKHAVEPIIAEAKDELINEYEDKFEEYKDVTMGRFSDFLDTFIDESIELPDEIVEYARVGQLYADLIEQFKIRLGIDEGAIDTEARNLLKEAKDEIISLRGSLNEKEGAILELSKDAREMATQLYIRKKCDGLTESQKNRVVNLLEGITDKRKIDEKFSFIVENLFVNEDDDNNNVDDKKVSDKKADEKVCICPECGRETSVTEGACELYKCPDCEDVKLTEKKNEKVEDKKQDDKVDEQSNKKGFDLLMENWSTTLKSKKF